MTRFRIRKVSPDTFPTERWELIDRPSGKRYRCGTFKFALILAQDIVTDGHSCVSPWRYHGS